LIALFASATNTLHHSFGAQIFCLLISKLNRIAVRNPSALEGTLRKRRSGPRKQQHEKFLHRVSCVKPTGQCYRQNLLQVSPPCIGAANIERLRTN